MIRLVRVYGSSTSREENTNEYDSFEVGIYAFPAPSR